MKIDHLVVNIDEKYQNDEGVAEKINEFGIPYMPKQGKGTKGFKASNLWIGNEYFEMVNVLDEDGGGWVSEWTKMYHAGHRGLICLFIDVDDINLEYERLLSEGIAITKPEWLKFKWFFNLFTRTMPWMNSYLPFFDNVPLQLGFQQMKDDKSRDVMKKFMQPNSTDNNIMGIEVIEITGDFTDNDFKLICNVFSDVIETETGLTVNLKNNQRILFKKAEKHNVSVYLQCENNELKDRDIAIENVVLKTNSFE